MCVQVASLTTMYTQGLKVVVALSQVANQYFQEEEPWVLVKPAKPDEKKKSTKSYDPQRCGTVINIAANVALLLVTLGEPYMPSLTAKVRIHTCT